jgi:hypothetical protein
MSAALAPELTARVAEVQTALSHVYQLDLGLDASDFVLPAEEAQRLLPEGGPRSGVLVLEEEGELWLGVYLDAEDQHDSHAVVEETSHWVRLVWNASRGESVSCLQLELQGEIDQYVVHRLEGIDPLRHLRSFVWCDWMDSEIQARYATAHRVAHRYCHELERRFPRDADTPRLLDELRAFYRADPDARLRVGG